MQNIDLSEIKYIHFSGIKGVGMTALALYAQDMGYAVSGSDVAEEFVTSKILEIRKIPINIGFSKINLPKKTQLLIYSAARPRNPQILYAQKIGVPAMSYAQALSSFTQDKKTVAVCGVGGKTTTTAMLAWILDENGLLPSFIDGVGNIPNLKVPGRWTPCEIAVVEADDYASVPGIDDTPKFLYLNPGIIILTNIEHDHPDVYQNLEQTFSAFLKFFTKAPDQGLIIANWDNKNNRTVLKKLARLRPDLKILTYGTADAADWKIKNINIKNKQTKFKLSILNREYQIKLKVPGEHAVHNAAAALLAAHCLGVDLKLSSQAIHQFIGTKRRFEKVGSYKGVEVWDDYAHHPTQIKETLKAAKLWFEGKRLILVFQPHTYSRTKSLFSDFTKSFKDADQVIITDIFSSAREKKDPSISAKILAQKTSAHHSRVHYLAHGSLLKYLQENLKSGDLLLTMGAGDIYKIAERLVKYES